MSAPPRQTRSVPFRPHFTLLLLYFFGFFVLFCFVLVLPQMIDAASQLPPGSGELTAEEKEIGAAVAREALSGRIPFALVAAIVTVAAGAYTGVLPGIRKRA